MFLHTESSRYPCRVSTNISKQTLLIVDDDPKIRTMLMRLFKHHFGSAFTAAKRSDAERILKENEITHMLCDYDLGSDTPYGTALIPLWRRQYPSMQRALLLTGHRLSTGEIPSEVDLYFEKGTHPAQILKALKS